ncbi:MAG: hypothetical protein J3Q66DRAFT_426817 [Benniella sp.]|nr:MAG: hypothetical protein J3Q66DRAFT_426817 [Benniella sp.]
MPVSEEDATTSSLSCGLSLLLIPVHLYYPFHSPPPPPPPPSSSSSSSSSSSLLSAYYAPPTMPGLSEEYLFPISIFALNVLLAVFRSILLSSLGACFAIYSRHGGAYATSIRWIQHAGFIKMIRTLRNPRKYASSSAKVVLAVAFLATVAASFLDKGIAHFVRPSPYVDQRNIRTSLHTTTQFAPNYVYKIFAGWSITHPMNANITDTMKRMFNSTVAIPNAVSGEIYNPVTSAYTVQCSRFNISFGRAVNLTNDGCASVSISFLGNFSVGQYSKSSSSSGRWSILLSSGKQPYSVRTAPLTSFLNLRGPLSPDKESYIVGVESFRMRPFGGIGASDDNKVNYGLTSFPKTTTTKCIHHTNDITVNTITSTRFTFSDGVFDVLKTKKLFSDQSNDLLQSMQETFKNKTIAPSNTPVELWVEVRAMDASIEVLACSLDSFQSIFVGRDMGKMLECVYANINMMVVKQSLNSNILAELGEDGFWKPLYSTYMTMEYVMGITNGEKSPVSLASLNSDVAEVNDYMARLGSNFYADFDGGKLYVEYEITDMKLGFKIPFWILFLAGALLIAGVSVWLFATTLVGYPYTSSLYSVIVKQVPSEGDESTSRLVEVKLNPLTFDGIPVQLGGDNVRTSGPSGSGKEIA